MMATRSWGVRQMPNERLEIARYGIAKFIKEGNIRLPPNQREYKWQDEHVKDLYQDIAKVTCSPV